LESGGGDKIYCCTTKHKQAQRLRNCAIFNAARMSSPAKASAIEKRLKLHQDILDKCKIVVHKACKVGQLATPNDSVIFAQVSKSLASNTEDLAELVSIQSRNTSHPNKTF
jgi:hypothetical protein